MRLGSLHVAALVGVLVGCQHDLDRLKSERGQPGLRAGTGGGSSSDGGNAGGRAGSSGVGDAGSSPDAGLGEGDGGTDAGAATSCEPCPELTDAAKMLSLRTCCRGSASDECGLTFAQGGLCLPRMVPAQDNVLCPAARIGTLNLPGCCRPDGRCGVLADEVGLGCVVRDEALPQLGVGAAESIACEFDCVQDADCAGVPGLRVCAESPDHTHRFCASSCRRDRDCAEGLVCGLSNDVGKDRVLAICTEPVGEATPGELCSKGDDCVHRLCTQLGQRDPFCTELCVSPADCGAYATRCRASSIPTPSAKNINSFDVCLPAPAP